MFRGVFPPVVTIFKDDGALDVQANRVHVDFLIDNGVHGLYVLGTSGEFMHMNLKERELHATDVCEHVNGRVPVIIGTGTASTRETVRLSRHAQGIGASAVSVVTPYFWRLSEREIIAHYSAVANAIDIPIIVYNFPETTGINISSDTLGALAREHRNIAGVKDSLDSLEHLRQRVQVMKSINPNFSILTGSDGLLMSLLSLGGDGSVPATANFAPRRHVALYDAWANGDVQGALRLLPDLLSCLDVFRVPGSFLTVIKEAMAMTGVGVPGVARQPALPLTAESRARLRDALSHAGLLPGAEQA
jgi:2-dehydro-3-deoxy-D-pentonate aldolase